MVNILIDPEKILDLPKMIVEDQELWRVSRGQTIEARHSENTVNVTNFNGQQIALIHDGRLVAICEGREDNKLYPHVVLLDATPNG